MLSRTVVTLLVLLLTAETATASNATPGAPVQVGSEIANNQGSEAQRLACTPDVFRLCSQFIPDVDNIVGCLRHQRPHLSPACHAVFR